MHYIRSGYKWKLWLPILLQPPVGQTLDTIIIVHGLYSLSGETSDRKIS